MPGVRRDACKILVSSPAGRGTPTRRDFGIQKAKVEAIPWAWIGSQIIGKTQPGNETRYNSKRKESTVYKEGDYVMIGNTDTTAGVNKKLIPKFRGPYQIKKVLERDRYIVGDIDGFQVTQRPYNSIVALDNMKPYVEV
ncbi:hypothetical protein ANTQUA_LOCUS2205 [Anthophora quadrimaculata]